ncbi:MAG: hypothetical protein KKC37_02665 [Proteobacteria bacterium]|nr:hypothetical protein [Pseudomonadota bacterium]
MSTASFGGRIGLIALALVLVILWPALAQQTPPYGPTQPPGVRTPQPLPGSQFPPYGPQGPQTPQPTPPQPTPDAGRIVPGLVVKAYGGRMVFQLPHADGAVYSVTLARQQIRMNMSFSAGGRALQQKMRVFLQNMGRMGARIERNQPRTVNGRRFHFVVARLVNPRTKAQVRVINLFFTKAGLWVQFMCPLNRTAAAMKAANVILKTIKY